MSWLDKETALSVKTQESGGEIEQLEDKVLKLPAFSPLRHKRPDFFL
jgi:hypothetical protein